jgi:phosphohistidine phosphatase
MEIYFVRHGPAGQRNEWRGDDGERPLTDEGRQLMVSVAAGLKSQNIMPDLILTSPLVRARQTAELLAAGLGIPGRLVIEKRLAPGFSAETFAKILRAYPDVSALMLVGHEPDFSATVGKLIGGGRVVCKKGGLAHVELPDPKTLKGKLVALIPPRMICGD